MAATRSSRSALILLLALSFVPASHAVITLVFVESDGNVTASFSGNWDVSAVTTYTNASNGGAITAGGLWSYRPGELSYAVAGVNSPWVPIPWSNATATSWTGDQFGFDSNILVYGPAGFTPGTSIAGSLFFASTTLEDIGLTAGEFGTLTGPAGTLNWSASLAAVPEPSTYAAMAGTAVLGLAWWRRRRVVAKSLRPDPVT